MRLSLLFPVAVCALVMGAGLVHADPAPAKINKPAGNSKSASASTDAKTPPGKSTTPPSKSTDAKSTASSSSSSVKSPDTK